MGAGGLPGEAERAMVTVRCERCMGTGELESSDSTDDRWWTCRLCEGTGKRTFADRRRSLADPASALRAVLSDPAGREALREMLTSEVVLAAARRAPTNNLCRPCEECARAAFDAAVDALASGVEGDAGTEGEGR